MSNRLRRYYRVPWYSAKCRLFAQAEQGDPTEGEHRSVEQKFWRRQFGLSLITTIAAIAAFVVAILAFNETKRQADAAVAQVSEAKSQTEQAKKQTQAAERQVTRAWFYIDLSRQFMHLRPVDVNTPFRKIHVRAANGMTITNYGSVPGKIINIMANLTVCPLLSLDLPAEDEHDFANADCLVTPNLGPDLGFTKIVQANGKAFIDQTVFQSNGSIEIGNLMFHFDFDSAAILSHQFLARLVIDVKYDDPNGSDRETRYVALSNGGAFIESNNARFDFHK